MEIKISDSVKYIGVDDKDIDLFENQYIVPNGVSYNSYVIIDEKIAVMDTTDHKVCEKWLSNLSEALAGRTPDYLIISHLEPDHSGNIKSVADKYPDMKLVMSAKAATMLPQFCEIASDRIIKVKENDSLELGKHTLHFVMAPMVHWPEVMVEYESTEKILFSADGFGKFGTLDTDEDWVCEARRYYFNIVGKYGTPVQNLLKKASSLEIKTICPLHGPVLNDNLGYYINKYDIWSSYKPEDKGVLIAYASIHGNTAKVAEKLAEILDSKGIKTVLTDLSRADVAEAVEDAFKYDKTVLCASSYDGGVFPPMETFLCHLKSKTFQNRTVAIIENASWAASAARTIKSYLEQMKNITLIEPVITIKSTMKDSDIDSIKQLAEKLAE